MGLLDIWNDWKKESGYGSSIEDIAKQSQYGQMDFSTQTQKKQDKDPRGFTGIGTRVTGQEMQKPNVVPSGYKDAIMSGGAGAQQGDIGFFQKLANMANVDFDKAAAQWKDKGGFEGLMANPMFTLGLGLMKSSATGQPIAQSLLDNAVTAGAISSQYADRIKQKSEVLAPVTEAQRDEVAAVLAEDDYYEPNILDRLKRGNQQAKYREALDSVYDRAEKIAKKEAKSGKSVRFGRKHIRQALKALEKEGKIKKRDPSFFGIIGGTVEATGKIDGAREMGGPVTQGKNYLVGEAGPEIFTPKATGKVVSNDDSNVVNMLLEANPQLKNVSLERATKILKNRFPDYF